MAVGNFPVSRFDASAEEAALFDLDGAFAKEGDLNSSRLWKAAGYVFIVEETHDGQFRIAVVRRNGTTKGYFGYLEEAQ